MNRDGDIGILIRNFMNFAESRSCQILTIILLRNLMSEKWKKIIQFWRRCGSRSRSKILKRIFTVEVYVQL